ncbi:MAG TPA: EAL domain-containing protein [Acidobacteriaceae bacterium]|jgi:diguanylate cyclase (GGDEF)-like protein/PAS domain S-box-containing protein
MKSFSDWSIRHKLTALLVVMACVTTVSVIVPMGAFDLAGLKQSMALNLTTLSDVLSRNSTAALTFHDAEAAQDVLQALRAESSVTAACIYAQDGTPLALYVRDGSTTNFVPPPVQVRKATFERDRLVIFHRIVLDSEQVGTIYIESDLQELHQRLRAYNTAALGTALIALLLAFLLARGLQRPISRPLIELVHTSKAVSQGADYSIRAGLASRDEFGQLVFAFNDMLEQIERRDLQLRRHREHLEEEVASRTTELFAANARLKLHAEALKAAANSVLITDLTGKIVWCNPAFSVSSGYSSEEVLGKTPRLLHSGKHSSEFYRQMWETIGAGETWRGEIVNRRKDGELYTEEMTITPVSSQSGWITHFVAIKQDITNRKLAEQALSQAEEKYRAIFEDAVIGIFQITPEGRPVSINRALAQMHGYNSPEEFLTEVSDLSHEVFVDPLQVVHLLHEVAADGQVRGAEVEVYRRDRTRKWVVANMRANRDANGEIVLYEGTIEDITDRKIAEERVQFLAYYDALTGLPNRVLLQDRIGRVLAGARRRKEVVAVLFLDLDRFKIINDSLGHSFGDALLQEAAARLQVLMREQDTVARVGGDEFVAVLTSVKRASDAAVAAQRVVSAMAAEFCVNGHSINVTCSVGISMFPEHGLDGETLIKNADAAMYCAKQRGPNNIEFFTDDLNIQIMERLTLENGLRLALERKELFLEYQPQMDIATGGIVGVEALARWRHPELGLVPPDRFIRIAENSGLIVPIGEWVLMTACTQARKWQKEGLPPMRIAVNVSAVQFRQDGFRDLIRRVLLETELDPQYLELELTESLLLSNADVMFSVLQELSEMGLKLAIDDFGTGYSSLSYLRQFPVNKLKIDRSFVRDVAVNVDDAAITTAIIGMARTLNLKVLAEGVEDEAQMSFLRAHRCDEIQGYYFSKPLLADDFATTVIDATLDVPTRVPAEIAMQPAAQALLPALSFSSTESD